MERVIPSGSHEAATDRFADVTVKAWRISIGERKPTALTLGKGSRVITPLFRPLIASRQREESPSKSGSSPRSMPPDPLSAYILIFNAPEAQTSPPPPVFRTIATTATTILRWGGRCDS
ncbi:hypothetical protein N7475_009215 [Penicillium sp. IBT 31633x]|nr:hypothetical protein N7475_009215 [Penicillium sp. IBT 31633x]